MLPPVVTGVLLLIALALFISAIGTGSAAIAEAKKGTKFMDAPLKGEWISSVVMCAACMCIVCVVKSL
jgi:hypothetical protein